MSRYDSGMNGWLLWGDGPSWRGTNDTHNDKTLSYKIRSLADSGHLWHVSVLPGKRLVKGQQPAE